MIGLLFMHVADLVRLRSTDNELSLLIQQIVSTRRKAKMLWAAVILLPTQYKHSTSFVRGCVATGLEN